MPPTSSVPPPPKAPIPKPNPQPYVGRAVSKQATSVSAEPQQVIGVAKSIQPKQPANAPLPQALQKGRGVEKSALAGRKAGI